MCKEGASGGSHHLDAALAECAITEHPSRALITVAAFTSSWERAEFIGWHTDDGVARPASICVLAFPQSG